MIYDEMKRLGFLTYEDVLPIFTERFSNDFDNVTIQVITTTFRRNPDVVAKERANGDWKVTEAPFIRALKSTKYTTQSH